MIDHGVRGRRVSAWMVARKALDDYYRLRRQEIHAVENPFLDWAPSPALEGLAARAMERIEAWCRDAGADRVEAVRRACRAWGWDRYLPWSRIPTRDHHGITCVSGALGHECA